MLQDQQILLATVEMSLVRRYGFLHFTPFLAVSCLPNPLFQPTDTATIAYKRIWTKILHDSLTRASTI
jgi:hypothetical protein